MKVLEKEYPAHYYGPFGTGIPAILPIEDIPGCVVVNPYLQKGYRLNYHRPLDLLYSIVEPHNELLNIWTHLFGAIIFFYIGMWMTINPLQLIKYFEGHKPLQLELFILRGMRHTLHLFLDLLNETTLRNYIKFDLGPGYPELNYSVGTLLT